MNLWDVLIIGSGHAGGMAAKILTRRASLPHVERPDPSPTSPGTPQRKPAYELPFRGFKPPGRLEHVYQSSGYNANVWVDEEEVPYTFNPDHPITGCAYACLAGDPCSGRGNLFASVTLNSKASLTTVSGKTGPSTTRKLAPFYSRVEDIFQVAGAMDGPAQMPNGNFVPDTTDCRHPCNVSLLPVDRSGSRFASSAELWVATA